MTASVNDTGRPDRLGALLAAGFVVLLLGSEAVLTLPDEAAADAAVASFYTDHRAVVIVLQVVGLVAAALLVGYGVRLRAVDRAVGSAAVVTGVLGSVPGLVTVVVAVVADPGDPGPAGTWNRLQPRGDDLLFLGVVALGLTVAVRLRHRPLVAGLGGLVALLCVARLGLEAAGQPRGAFDSLGPLGFVLLVAVLGALSWRGRLSVRRRVPGGGR